jgi:predicted signal transduction protein with EAL and GGDEF domain
MSFGVISCIPDLNENKESLFEKADIALYRAKNSGRNKAVFYEAAEAEKEARVVA